MIIIFLVCNLLYLIYFLLEKYLKIFHIQVSKIHFISLKTQSQMRAKERENIEKLAKLAPIPSGTSLSRMRLPHLASTHWIDS